MISNSTYLDHPMTLGRTAVTNQFMVWLRLSTMSANNRLEWSPLTPLKWDDFEADPHPGVYQDVQTHVGYDCTWTIQSHKKDDQLLFTIHNIRLTTRFSKNLSWVRIGAATDSLLRHAQGCFDLAENIRPRIEDMMKKEFEDRFYPVRGSNEVEHKQYSKQDSRVVLSVLSRIQSDVLSAEVAKYRERTCYGENITVQKEYNQRFARLRPSGQG